MVHALSCCFALTRSGSGHKSPQRIRTFPSPEDLAIPLSCHSDHEITGKNETGRKLLRNQAAVRVHGRRNYAESDERLESDRRDVFV